MDIRDHINNAWEAWLDLKDRFGRKVSAPFTGKHRHGTQKPKNYRLHLRRHRKAERQARRYARLRG